MLVINDFNGEQAWSRERNNLGLWTGADSFSNGGGAGVVSAGALTLRYENDGWFGSDINIDLSKYSHLVVRLKGAAGGEQGHFHLKVGARTTVFAHLTLAGGAHPVVRTSYQDFRVPLQANGMSSTRPEQLSMGFWHGDTTGTVSIDSISLSG